MDSPRPCKRRRASPSPAPTTTPPTTIHDPEGVSTLDRAINVLSVQAEALSNVTRLYQTDPVARDGLLRAVDYIVTSQRRGGKTIVCGVGKSGLIGNKTVATLKSLGIGASFMHASEAAHGDLGDIREHDVILFISFSGKTPELLNILPHLRASQKVLAMTSHLKADDCPLLRDFENSVLLPAPIHESEESTFGVCAPTTSTTVAVAIGDMLALTVGEQLHGEKMGKAFKKNHPGGAIGALAALENEIKDLPACEAITIDPLALPSPSISARSE